MIAIAITTILAVGAVAGIAFIAAALADAYAHWRAGSADTGVAVVAVVLVIVAVAVGLSAALLVAGVLTGASA